MKARIARCALPLGYLLALAGLIAWTSAFDRGQLRLQLAVLTPSWLQVIFLLVVGGAWAARSAIRRSLPRGLWPPLLLASAALAAAWTLPPETHRIYYDEDIYQNVAQNILWRGRAEMCNEGVIEEGSFTCHAAEYNKEPNGFPFVLSLAFRMTGVEERAAHFANRLLFTLGVAAAYWVGGLLLRDARAALAAGVLFLLTPQNLLWGATAAAEPGAAALAAIAVGAWVLFLREGGPALLVFGGSAVAFAVQWRPESVLLIPLLGLGTILFNPESLGRRSTWAAALLVLALSLPHIAHLHAVSDQEWGSPDGQKFAWRYVPGNLKTNAAFFVEGRDFPVYFTLLALLGIASPGRTREKIFVLTWFVLFFGIFVPFHAGSYRYGADIRFSLVSALPVALLGAAGAGWVGRWVAARAPARPAAAALPFVLAVYFFSGYLPLVRSVGTEAWAARADHEAAREMIALVPERSLVLTHNPGMLQVMGTSAAQLSFATEAPVTADHYFRRFPGGVYFHYNFWCNVPDPAQNAFCAKLLAGYPTQVVTEQSAGFYRYVLYRVLPPRGSPETGR